MTLYLSNQKKNLKNYLTTSILKLTTNYFQKIIEDLKLSKFEINDVFVKLYGQMFSSVKENYFFT